MKKLFQILRYVSGYKRQAVLNIVFNLLFVVFNLLSLLLFIPFLNLLFGVEEETATVAPDVGWTLESLEWRFSQFLDSFVQGSDKLDLLAFFCIAIMLLFLLKNLFRFLAMMAVSYLHTGVARDIRQEVYEKILALPLSFFSDERKGDIIARSTADVHEVETSIIKSLEMVFRDPINIVITLATMVLISPQLTLFSLILLPVTGLMISKVGKSLKRSSLRAQEQQGDMLSYLEETIGGMAIVKSFTAEGVVSKTFARINDALKKTLTRTYVKQESASPLSEFLGSCVMVGIVWYGGRLILADGADQLLSGSEFIGFILMFYNLLRPVQNMSKSLMSINRGLASVERVNAILHADNPIVDKASAITEVTFDEAVTFDKVSFAYGAEQVLSEIDITLSKGRSIALVGESGGGKSTIANLLPRFYDVSAGGISIDGMDIREMRIHALRGLMGVVAQQSILFNDTVFGNIALGKEGASKEEVMAAAKVANAHEFIEALPQGYRTNIGDGGNKLSGGQKQRLSIARAVLKNPPILILDEATSALDTESEKLVQDALIRLMKDRTSLIIAHRLSTIQHADEILVLQKGRVVERGRHEDLIAKGGVYKRLCDLQGFS